MDIVNSFVAHESNVIKSVVVDPVNNLLYSGATKGDIKVILRLILDLGY
jgi:hypothetical protein